MKGDGLNFVDVLGGELYNLSDRVIIDAVDDRDDQRDFDANLGEVLNRPNFYLDRIRDMSARLQRVRDGDT